MSTPLFAVPAVADEPVMGVSFVSLVAACTAEEIDVTPPNPSQASRNKRDGVCIKSIRSLVISFSRQPSELLCDNLDSSGSLLKQLSGASEISEMDPSLTLLGFRIGASGELVKSENNSIAY